MESMRIEFPRPDFEREEWLSLNGEWEFDFDDYNIGIKDKWYQNHFFDLKINVPFCYQSDASRITDESYHPILWYAKRFTKPKFKNERIFLCFGAVDYLSNCFINGIHVCSHEGGYTPFSVDITDYLSDDNCIVLRVEDKNDPSQPRGKQYWQNGEWACWYKSFSGIWQSVWLEGRSSIFIDKIFLTPDIDTSSVSIRIILSTYISKFTKGKISISSKGILKAELELLLSKQETSITVEISQSNNVDETEYWHPDNPNLFNVEISIDDGDKVFTYFGFRKVSIRDGHIMLNNMPIYQKLILHQGYYYKGHITALSDDDYVRDILLIKDMGFNGIRLHQKIEDPRFYYHADRLGLLVWGELPSAYEYCLKEKDNILRDIREFIYRDYNHPSIICWVPLNESWGVRKIVANKDVQEFASTLYNYIKIFDRTRLIDTNDGWEQVVSDLCTIHDYAKDGKELESRFSNIDFALKTKTDWRLIYANGHHRNNEPILISEFGGIAFCKDIENGKWGYKDGVRDEKEFIDRFSSLIRYIRGNNIFQGYCYTQFTDVYQEANGLLAFNRNPKVSIEEIRKIVH